MPPPGSEESAAERPRNLRDEQKAFTRQRIIEAARGLFEDRGYTVTTVDDIAEAAGGSRATVYRHFANKLEIFVALAAPLEEEIDVRWPELDAALQAGDRKAVESWFKGELAWFQQNSDLLPARDEVFATEPTYRQMIQIKVADVESRMPDYVAAWGKAKRRRAQIRLDLLQMQMDQFFTRWARMEAMDPDLDEVAAELAAIWFPALRP